MRVPVVAKAILIAPDGDVLLLRRNKKARYRPGEWDFAGGKVEDGEDMTEALLREIKEETGYILGDNDVSLTHVFTKELGDSPGICHLSYLGYVKDKNLQIDTYEHEEFMWLPIDKAIKTHTYLRQKQVLEYIQKHQLLA